MGISLSQTIPARILTPYSFKVYFSIIILNVLQGLPRGIFLQILRPKFCTHFLFLPNEQ
jgi:hypothetical protein